MKIKCTRNISIDGKSYAAGEIADVPDRDARLMISIDKAVAVGADPGRDPAQVHLKDDPEKVETREPAVSTRDPVIKKSKLAK